MAYVNGEWLDREARDQRIQLVKERASKLLALYKAGKASDYHIEKLREDNAELKRLKRINRAETDFGYFMYEYFSDAENPDNDDNIIRNADDGTKHDPLDLTAPIHREFFELCDHISNVKRNDNLAIAAARGHSKSGFFSNGLPIRELVYRKRKFILIVSETDGLSKRLIGWINQQLKHNEKLRADFGPLMNPKANQNIKDNDESFITAENQMVNATSSGKRNRGQRHGALRPDLVIIDDPSSDNNEGTKDARDKIIQWFNREIIPIGSKGTAIVLVGTMVSGTGLLNHVLHRKDFKSSYHGAIVSEPDHPELWEEYCEIYANAEDFSEAEEFYQANKAQLEAGVKTAWPWRWTYRDLMHEKVNMGTRAFNSEYRNIAFSEDEQYFFPDKFAYYHYEYDSAGNRYIIYEGERIPLSDLTISGAWDIAMGRNARSCFNSSVTVGKHKKSGRIFVLDEYATKEMPHKFLDKIVEIIKRFGHNVYSVETINAYHEFYRQLEERLRLEGIYSTKLNPIKSHKSSKEERIESLEPLCENKTLVFNRSHTTLLDQMAQFPFGDYVDSIDALSMSVEHIKKPKARIIDKPPWL